MYLFVCCQACRSVWIGRGQKEVPKKTSQNWSTSLPCFTLCSFGCSFISNQRMHKKEHLRKFERFVFDCCCPLIDLLLMPDKFAVVLFPCLHFNFVLNYMEAQISTEQALYSDRKLSSSISFSCPISVPFLYPVGYAKKNEQNSQFCYPL